MSEQAEQNTERIDSLRSRMDADARFRRVMTGYDPLEVRAYVENVKRIFSQQAKAAKQEQDTLIAQMDSAKSEIQARNCAIKKLKEMLLQREAQLSSANARIDLLLQSVKKHEVEREELNSLRELTKNFPPERVEAMQNEIQQLYAEKTQNNALLDSLKIEREHFSEENERLKQELYYQRAVAMRPMMPDYESARLYAPLNMPNIPNFPSMPNMQNVQPRQPYPEMAPTETKAAPQMSTSVPKDFAQVADKLASMFADAYMLISQFKSGGTETQPETAAQRPAQPFMQILRPDGAVSENPVFRK